jgi:chromosome transmission fidelity protein 1
MDSICSINSCSVTLAQLKRGKAQVIIYLQKFRNKLKGKNRGYVAQIVRVLDSLIAILESKSKKDGLAEGVLSASTLLSGKAVDQIDLFKLDKYLKESKLAWKVDGYAVAEANEQQAGASVGARPTEKRSTTPVLMHIQTFLLSLLNPSTSGRFIYTRDSSTLDVKLDYMLLDPTPQFREIVDSARSVILAGGTMSPMGDYARHLFGYLPEDRLATLSCEHIVPKSSLAVYTIGKASVGGRQQEMCFTHERRNTTGMIVAAGITLLETARVVPDGVVAFFPSYDYLSKCLSVWHKELVPNGSPNQTIWQALSAVKPVFTESSSKASSIKSVDGTVSQPNTLADTLASFTNAINSPPTPHRGALLLAVTSGSLSEGINFSDSLGRCVLLFGLPFANRHVLPLSAKLAYIESQATAEYLTKHTVTPTPNSNSTVLDTLQAKAKKEGQRAAGEWYENSTMRAVNQAVGRAIRHRNDFAAVVLVDSRFESERVRGKLAGWMRESVRTGQDVGSIAKGLKMFFKTKGVS